MVSGTPSAVSQVGIINGSIRQHTCSAQASLPELIPLKILFGNPEKTSPDVREPEL